MKSKILLPVIVLLLSVMQTMAQSEADFYKETINDHTLGKNLHRDYGVDGTGSFDSGNMQQTINEVAKAGGGKIFLPSGIYILGKINLQTKVHLLIDKNAVIKPFVINNGKSITLFKRDNNIFNTQA